MDWFELALIALLALNVVGFFLLYVRATRRADYFQRVAGQFHSELRVYQERFGDLDDKP